MEILTSWSQVHTADREVPPATKYCCWIR